MDFLDFGAQLGGFWSPSDPQAQGPVGLRSQHASTESHNIDAGASEASGGPLCNTSVHMNPDARKPFHMHLGTKTYKEQAFSNYTRLYTYQYTDTCMDTQRHTNRNSTRLHDLRPITRFPFPC